MRGPSSRPRSCVGPPPRGRSEPALLLQTASGNVEAKVVCFYRRRDISSSLIALADKHASESAARAAPAPGGPAAPVPGPSAGGGGAVHVLGWTVPCTVQGSQAWGGPCRVGAGLVVRGQPVVCWPGPASGGGGPHPWAPARVHMCVLFINSVLVARASVQCCAQRGRVGFRAPGPPRACAHWPGTACGLRVLSRGAGSWGRRVGGPGLSALSRRSGP